MRIIFFVLSTFYLSMTLDDNLAGIINVSQEGIGGGHKCRNNKIQKNNSFTWDRCPPQQLYNKHLFFFYRNCPAPPPSKDLLICKEYNTLLQKYYRHRQLLWQKRWETPSPRQEEVVQKCA